jgi:hypothetical protein
MNFSKFIKEMEELKPTQEMKDWFAERTNRHISLVQKWAKKLEDYNPKRFKGIIEQCKYHDASKFEEPEYTPYLYVSWKYRCKDLGKDFNISKDIEDQMHEATLHHVKVNSHHPEYFDKESEINKEDRDKKPEKIVDATEMDDMNIFEMLCDWQAMGEEKNNTIREWADKNCNVRWKFTPEQTELIYDIIEIFESMKEE